MILVLFNREEIWVSQQEAAEIERLIEADYKWIKIRQYRFQADSIIMIKPAGYGEADRLEECLGAHTELTEDQRAAARAIVAEMCRDLFQS
jgi:hypothetical protein